MSESTLLGLYEVSAKVRSVIVDELGVAEEALTPQARIIQDLGADSLDALNLTLCLEEVFGIEIPDDDAERLLTVGDVCNYVDRHVPAEVK